jgi:hypothetical protein
MRRHYLTSVAAIALALGMTAAGAQNVEQNVDQRRDGDAGKQTDQLGNNHQPQISGQSQDAPPQQRRDPDNRQDAQKAVDRQQDNRQSEQGSNQQQGAQQQKAPVTSGQSRENAREPQQGQNQQQGAQTPQQSTQDKSGQDATDRQQGERQPEQRPNQQEGAQQQNAGGQSRENARELQQGQNRQQDAQAPQQGTQNKSGQDATDRQRGEQRPNQQEGAQQQKAPVTSGQSQENAQEPQQGQNPQQGAQAPRPAQSQQGVEEPRQGDAKQRGAKNEQPDKSGRIALDESEQMRVGDIIRQQRIKPVTNLDFSLSAGSIVPASVRLARISGELADIFPQYRDFSFFVARQELVIVDSHSYGIVGFVPISGGGTVGIAPPREEKTGTVGTATAAPPAPTKKKAERPEKKRVTEEKPRVEERETIRRSPAHTETDVTVGTSRREIEEFDGPPPRDRDIGPPTRERFERDEDPPFPFSLFFGRPN